MIDDQKAEIIEHQKLEDIDMPESSKSLILSKKELRVIARKRGVKNYENLPKSRLIKEINGLKPSRGSKKEEKIVNSLLLKQKINITFKPRKKSRKDVYKPIKIRGTFSDNFVEYKSNSKKDKSIARYLNNIRELLRKLINDKGKKENV